MPLSATFFSSSLITPTPGLLSLLSLRGSYSLLLLICDWLRVTAQEHVSRDLFLTLSF